ncbi:MAG: hypothetical protein KUG73_12445, partial [Pseudomonadales bacterium]|nr:hypothetical protein [Pseudomonadales bacterium]
RRWPECTASIITTIINETVLIVRLCNITPYAVNEGFNKKKQQQEIFLLFLEQVLPVNNLDLLGGLRVAYHFIRGDIRGSLIEASSKCWLLRCEN